MLKLVCFSWSNTGKHIHKYAYAQSGPNVHKYIYTCIHAYTHKDTKIHTYIHTYIHTHIQKCAQADPAEAGNALIEKFPDKDLFNGVKFMIHEDVKYQQGARVCMHVCMYVCMYVCI